ncbi:MAG: MmcQ/YjbR family DNA-binding protein [Flavobacteriales bacterium]
MDIEQLRAYCLSKPFATEHLPFDDRTLAFKVGGKIFALFDIVVFDGVNLKCDPELAIEWREQYEGVNPGYHMNKKHWNTVETDANISHALWIQMIDHSYALVFGSLPKSVREKLVQ